MAARRYSRARSLVELYAPCPGQLSLDEFADAHPVRIPCPSCQGVDPVECFECIGAGEITARLSEVD